MSYFFPLLSHTKLINCALLLATILILLLNANNASAGDLKLLSISTDTGKYSKSLYNNNIIDNNGSWATRLEDRDSDGQIDYVLISAYQGDANWVTTFSSTRLGIPLSPGDYRDAQEIPLEEPGHAGLGVAGNGQGCQVGKGHFTILDLQIDYTAAQPQLISFAATFTHYCGARTLQGVVYYNYNKADYALAANPNVYTMVQGISSDFIIPVASQNQITAPLSLSATIDPPTSEINTTFSSTTVSPGSTTTLHIQATPNAINQNYTVKITGADEKQLFNTTITLRVIIPPQLTLASDKGDFVGGGANYFHKSSNWLNGYLFDRTGDGLVDDVGFSFIDFTSTGQGTGIFWQLEFRTSLQGTELSPGVYNNAQRAAFADPDHAGMSIANVQGCNHVCGNFTVLDAQYDYSGEQPQLISFAVQFEQYCECASTALRGTFYYNSQPRDFFLTITPTSSSVKKGVNAKFTVTVNGVNGFNDSVDLSGKALNLLNYSKLKVHLSAKSARPGESVTAVVPTGSLTKIVGNYYYVTVVGTENQLINAATAPLTIKLGK